MIKINSLTKSYGKNLILDSLNLNLNSGEVYCLLGKNGAGKNHAYKCYSRFAAN